MHLDCRRMILSVVAVEHFAVFGRPKRWPQLLIISGKVSEHDLCARLAGRDLGVAIKPSDYLGRPRFKRAVRRSAGIQVDAAESTALSSACRCAPRSATRPSAS